LVRMRVSKQLLSRPDGIRSLLVWQHKKEEAHLSVACQASKVSPVWIINVV
jgi:hypothetical protein